MTTFCGSCGGMPPFTEHPLRDEWKFLTSIGWRCPQMKYKLNRGQALVIVGPQGCGKTTLAWNIARAYGKTVSVEPSIFNSPFDLGSVLEAEPKVLIVEGLPESRSIMEKVKELLTNRVIACHRKNRPAKEVKAPHIIFCSGYADGMLSMENIDRRFCVVNLGGKE